MAKYRKRPVIVEAEQWFPDKVVAGVDWEPPQHEPSRSGREAFVRPATAYVVTIHGQRAYLAPGDWVITEPDGVHHYPCKPDVFDKTYEPA
jgi:hypothetical protein